MAPQGSRGTWNRVVLIRGLGVASLMIPMKATPVMPMRGEVRPAAGIRLAFRWHAPGIAENAPSGG